MNEEGLDDIQVYSTVSAASLEPNVIIKWGEASGIITATDARKRAFALINAIALAQAEGGIFKALAPEIKPVGFGKHKPNKQEEMAVGILHLIRDVRAPLPPDIEPIFGYHTQQPLIKYSWGNKSGTLEIDTAKHHAQVLLEVAEAAETDSFFYKFCEGQNLDKQVAEDILREFSLFRQQNWLEDLL